MRLLVLGGGGQLGAELAGIPGSHRVSLHARHDTDVTEPGAIARSVADFEPDAVVNLAACHTYDSEADPRQAFEVNTAGALRVAAAARRADARCVFVSTDYVFDGRRRDGYREDDPIRPLNVYGLSKAAGEAATLWACPDGLVVRASGLFGHAGHHPLGHNFVATMLSKAAAGERLEVADDIEFAPTAARDLAERIVALLHAGAPPGVYHAANAGSCTWFEFAARIFELTGVDAELRSRRAGPDDLPRPPSSVLLDSKTAALGLPPARRWEDALAWYLGELPGR